MVAVPRASQAPAPVAPRLVTLPAPALARLAGDYDMSGGTIRVFVHLQRLFINVPGHGEAELFATSSATFAVLVVPGATVNFTNRPDGSVARLTLTLGRQVIERIRR